MSIFEIAKNVAKRVYREDHPKTLEEYQECIYLGIKEECYNVFGKCFYGDYQIREQAKKTALWWWENVWNKREDNFPRTLREEEEKKDTLFLLKNFKTCILDTETTGLTNKDRITELSIIDLEGNVLFSSLFNPEIPISQRVSELTGITDELVKDAPKFAEKACEIKEILNEYVVTGWNVGFDIKMLNFEFARTSVIFDRELMVHDLMALCAAELKYPSRYVKLVKVKQDLGIGERQEHRSLADCFDTLAVFNKILSR